MRGMNISSIGVLAMLLAALVCPRDALGSPWGASPAPRPSASASAAPDSGPEATGPTASPSPSPEVEVLTPLDVVILAVTRHPAVRAQRATTEGVEALGKGAAQPTNPALQLGVATLSNNLNTSQVLQYLNVFGEYGLRGRAATSETRASYSDLHTVVRQTIRTAVEAYYVYWVSLQKLDLARAFLDGARALNEAAKRKSGPTSHDVLRSQVELARARSEVTLANEICQSDRARLNSALGRLEDRELEVPDNTPGVDLDAPHDPYQATIPTLQDLLLQADTNRPEIDAARFRVNAARDRARLAGLNAAPYVGVQGNLNEWNYPTSTHGFQVTLNMPMFDWGGLSALRNQAKKNYDAARYKVEVQQLQVQLDVRTAWQAFQSAVSRQAELRASVGDFSTSFRQVIGDYQSGKLTIDDAINTQRAARDGFTSYLDAEGSLHTARMELLWASGSDLVPDLIRTLIPRIRPRVPRP